jgi:hypothetical protein
LKSSKPSNFGGLSPAGAFPHRPAANTGQIERSNSMPLGTILLIVLILFLVGALPTWPHSKSWGYYPSGGLGLVVAILLILVLTGRI